MSVLLVLPLIVPLAAAVLGLLASRTAAVQRAIAVGGAVAHAGSAAALLFRVLRHGVTAVQAGGWPAPFGITLVADITSALLVLLTGVLGVAVTLSAVADVDAPAQRRAFFAVLQVLLMGVSGAFLTGDLFNLYVWFEVLLLASFVLLTLGGDRDRLRAGVHYVAVNLVGSTVFLIAAGLTYGTAQTLNFADLALRLPALHAEHPRLVLVLAALFMLAFGLKAAMFPLGSWVPQSYPAPPAAVAAMFAGILTKVGVYALLRILTLCFPPLPTLQWFLLWLAGLTMVLGVIGAVAQVEMRRILAFHSISQIGYMLLATALVVGAAPAARPVAVVALLVFMVHHGLVKSNLFLVSGAVGALRGTTRLEPLGGLATAAPQLAMLFFIAALSLAGLPPLSGFWAKLTVVQASFNAAQWPLAAAALGTGLLTLLSMMKIWNEVFWKAPPLEPAEPPRALPATRRGPIIGLVVLIVAVGLWPGPLLDLAGRAAEQLLTRQTYIDAVGLVRPFGANGALGDGPPVVREPPP